MASHVKLTKKSAKKSTKLSRRKKLPKKPNKVVVTKSARKARVPNGTWAKVILATRTGRVKKLVLDSKDRKSAKLGLHQAAYHFRKANKRVKFSLHIEETTQGLKVYQGGK